MFFSGLQPLFQQVRISEDSPRISENHICFISLGPSPQLTGQKKHHLVDHISRDTPIISILWMLISPRYPVVISFHHVWGYSQYIPTISLIFVGYIFHLLFTPDVCYFNPPVGVVRLTSWIGSCAIDRRVIGTSTRWARSCNWLERPRFPTFLFSSRQGSNQLGQLAAINWLD